MIEIGQLLWYNVINNFKTGAKMKKRILVFIMLSLILIMTACSDLPDKSEETSAQTTVNTNSTETTIPEETKLVANIPEGTNYNNYQFIIANSFQNETKYTTNAIDPGEITGDVLNDAIYQRTMMVEELVKIDVVDQLYTVEQMKTSINAGDVNFDLMTVNLSGVRGFINLGAVIDFYDLDGIDLEMPWWDQNAQEKLSVNGKLFYTLSDFLITGLDNGRAVYFNKKMHRNLELENVYDLVKNNGWTLEKMREMGLQAVSDLNGDGAYNESDSYGMLCFNATSFYEAYLTSSDAEIMKQSDSGIPYFYAFEPRFADVYIKLLDVFSTDNMTFLKNDLNLFMEDHALFTTWTMFGATRLREMDTDFGILPLPKYDAAQDKYWHVSPNPHALMVPIATQDEERTGIILEALSYYSSSSYSDTTVIPAYFELAVKGKTTRDEESLEMLDIIKNSISYIIKLDDSGMTSSIYNAFGANSRNIASILKASKKPAETALARIFNAMGVEGY